MQNSQEQSTRREQGRATEPSVGLESEQQEPSAPEEDDETTRLREINEENISYLRTCGIKSPEIIGKLLLEDGSDLKRQEYLLTVDDKIVITIAIERSSDGMYITHEKYTVAYRRFKEKMIDEESLLQENIRPQESIFYELLEPLYFDLKERRSLKDYALINEPVWEAAYDNDREEKNL